MQLETLPNEKASDLIYAAEKIYESTGDKQWAQRLIEMGLSEDPGAWEYKIAGELMCSILNNRKCAAEYFKKGVEVSEDGSDIAFIAESVFRDLKDPEWSRELLKEAVGKIKDANDLLLVANIIIEPPFKDRERAIKILKSLNDYEYDPDDIYLEIIMVENNIEPEEIDNK